MADPVTIDRKNAFTAEMHRLNFFVLDLFALLGSCFFGMNDMLKARTTGSSTNW